MHYKMFCRTRNSTRCFFKLFLACCVVLVYIQIQLLPISERNNIARSLQLESDKFPSRIVAWRDVCKPNGSIQDVSEYLSHFPLENTTKRLNIFRWENIKGYSINSLVRQPWFPRQPSTIDFASTGLVRHSAIHYGQWIAGYLHVDVTGNFKFALSSDDSSELWVSENESPDHSRRVAMVGDGYAPGWTTIGEHAKYLNQISDPMRLQKCKRYFIEILHKQSQGESFVALAWKRPGHDKFALVTGAYLSPFLSKVQKDLPPQKIIFNEGDSYEILQKALRKQRLNKLSLEISAKFVSSQLQRIEYSKEKRSMVACQAGEYKHPPARRAIDENIVSIYPLLIVHKTNSIKDTSKNKVLKLLQGNLGVLSAKDAKAIVAIYLALVEDFHPGKYSLSSVVNVESKKLPNLNERHLIELELRQQDSNVNVRVSDYVLKKWADETICTVQELQWNSKTLIQVVIIIEEHDGKWVLHLIDNIEAILEKNDDKSVHVTLIDYGQDYFDLHHILSQSSIPNFNLIRKTGADFYKIEAIRDAINSRTKSNRIVMVVDPHMKLPLDIMDQTRKHCIDGFMAFSPLAFHLNEGNSPAEPEGLWEYRGLPLIAMFNSDWEKSLPNSGNEETDEDLENQIQSRIDVVKIKMDGLYFLTEN